MTYNYDTEKQNLYTDEGQRLFLKIRDRTNKLLASSGAVMCQKIIEGCTGDARAMLACIDRLVELGEIREIHRSIETAAKNRVFVARNQCEVLRNVNQ